MKEWNRFRIWSMLMACFSHKQVNFLRQESCPQAEAVFGSSAPTHCPHQEMGACHIPNVCWEQHQWWSMRWLEWKVSSSIPCTPGAPGYWSLLSVRVGLSVHRGTLSDQQVSKAPQIQMEPQSKHMILLFSLRIQTTNLLDYAKCSVYKVLKYEVITSWYRKLCKA